MTTATLAISRVAPIAPQLQRHIRTRRGVIHNCVAQPTDGWAGHLQHITGPDIAADRSAPRHRWGYQWKSCPRAAVVKNRQVADQVIEKHRLAVVSLCLSSPLTRVSRVSAPVSATLPGPQARPMAPVRGKFLPWVTLNFVGNPIPDGAFVHQGVARDMVKGPLLGDAVSGLADHHDNLTLVVQLPAFRGRQVGWRR